MLEGFVPPIERRSGMWAAPQNGCQWECRGKDLISCRIRHQRKGRKSGLDYAACIEGWDGSPPSQVASARRPCHNLIILPNPPPRKGRKTGFDYATCIKGWDGSPPSQVASARRPYHNLIILPNPPPRKGRKSGFDHAACIKGWDGSPPSQVASARRPCQNLICGSAEETCASGLYKKKSRR
jgi:hypothetical protein